MCRTFFSRINSFQFWEEDNMHTNEWVAYVVRKECINFSKQPALIFQHDGEQMCIFSMWEKERNRLDGGGGSFPTGIDLLTISDSIFLIKNYRSVETWLIAQQQSFAGERETARESGRVGVGVGGGGLTDRRWKITKECKCKRLRAQEEWKRAREGAVKVLECR